MRFLPLRFFLAESASWLVGRLLPFDFFPSFEAAFLVFLLFTAGGLCDGCVRFFASVMADWNFSFTAAWLELVLEVTSFDCVTLVFALLELLLAPRGPVRGGESLAVAFTSLLVDGIGGDSFPLAFSRVFLGALLDDLLPPSLVQLLERASERGADCCDVLRGAAPLRSIVKTSFAMTGLNGLSARSREA